MEGHILATKQLFGTKITYKFKESVKVKEVPLTHPGPNQVLIKNRFVGVNPYELCKVGGRYDPDVKLPIALGLEAIGTVVATGNACPHLLNKVVLYMESGAFSDYMLVDHIKVVEVPKLDRNYIALLLSALTASIALDEDGRVNKGDIVLVTAAAGATGQFAVQWAKRQGCHVIGTCSTDVKADFLKSIGCDRPVVYTKEDLHDVLKKEYPKGVNVVYEAVGGKLFEAAIKNLAFNAKIVVVGFIESYLSEGVLLASDDMTAALKYLPNILISQAASLSGFLIFSQSDKFTTYIPKLLELYHNGKLHVTVDQGEQTEDGPFVGLENIGRAMEFLCSKKNKGKVIVELNPE